MAGDQPATGGVGWGDWGLGGWRTGGLAVCACAREQTLLHVHHAKSQRRRTPFSLVHVLVCQRSVLSPPRPPTHTHVHTRPPARPQVFLLCNNESEESLQEGRIVDVSGGGGEGEGRGGPGVGAGGGERESGAGGGERESGAGGGACPRQSRLGAGELGWWGGQLPWSMSARATPFPASRGRTPFPALYFSSSPPPPACTPPSLLHPQVKITYVTRDCLKVILINSGTEGMVPAEEVSGSYTGEPERARERVWGERGSVRS